MDIVEIMGQPYTHPEYKALGRMLGIGDHEGCQLHHIHKASLIVALRNSCRSYRSIQRVLADRFPSLGSSPLPWVPRSPALSRPGGIGPRYLV